MNCKPGTFTFLVKESSRGPVRKVGLSKWRPGKQATSRRGWYKEQWPGEQLGGGKVSKEKALHGQISFSQRKRVYLPGETEKTDMEKIGTWSVA